MKDLLETDYVIYKDINSLIKDLKKPPVEKHEILYRTGKKAGQIRKTLYEPDFKKCFKLNGNEISCAVLIKLFKLKFSKFDYSHLSFNNIHKKFFPTSKHFDISTSSVHGHSSVNMTIKNRHVRIEKNPKTDYEYTYGSNLIKDHEQIGDFVVLHINTTGDNPLINDLIEISIYSPNGKSYHKFLPLVKKTQNTAFNHNNIPVSQIQEATPLTQEEVKYLIDYFNLKTTTIVSWSQFERLFLEVYFIENNLPDIDCLTFAHTTNIIKSVIIPDTKTFKREDLFTAYNITTTTNSCSLCESIYKLTAEILNKNLNPALAILKQPTYTEFEIDASNTTCKHIIDTVKNITHPYNKDFTTDKFTSLYYNFCNALKVQHGLVLRDYDKKPDTRGKEWIDIHHINEILIPNISVITQEFEKLNFTEGIKSLSLHNKKENLVYATKIEHFLLHVLITYIKNEISTGVHLIMKEILKVLVGKLNKNTPLYRIQKNNQVYFERISIDEFFTVYKTLIKNFNCQDYVIWWELDTYPHDEEDIKKLIEFLKN